MTSLFPSRFLEILELMRVSIKRGKASEFFLLKMYDYLFLSHPTSQPAPFEHQIACVCGNDVGAQYKEFASNRFKVHALLLAIKAREDFFLLCMVSTPENEEEREKALKAYRDTHRSATPQSVAFLKYFPDLLVRDPDFFARVDKELIAKLAEGKVSNAAEWRKPGNHIGLLFDEINRELVLG